MKLFFVGEWEVYQTTRGDFQACRDGIVVAVFYTRQDAVDYVLFRQWQSDAEGEHLGE